MAKESYVRVWAVIILIIIATAFGIYYLNTQIENLRADTVSYIDSTGSILNSRISSVEGSLASHEGSRGFGGHTFSCTEVSGTTSDFASCNDVCGGLRCLFGEKSVIGSENKELTKCGDAPTGFTYVLDCVCCE